MTDKPFTHYVAIQTKQHATMTFDELTKSCTPDERDQLAWHLAIMRARNTYEKLRHAPDKSRALSGDKS